jgi:NAD(P)-dependent dehydrogenase (short-subunit alcohol dehydrogenase family)
MTDDASKPASGMCLSAKAAVVTGASRGIGLAIAKALASEACNVFISGRNQQTIEQAAAEIRAGSSGGARIISHVCDVRDERAVEHMFARVRDELGRLDILVNNAGVAQPIISIEETSIDLWRELVDTNLTGTFLCTKFALPLMPRGATIINTLSPASKMAFPKFAAYNSSKFGALGFTLSLREDLKERGIRVTALIPGSTDTDIWNQFWPDAARGKMMEAESVAKLVLEAVVLSPKANLTELVLDPIEGAL